MRVITYIALIRPILCVFRDFFNAAVHGIYSLGEDVAVGWNSLRFVAFSRLYGLPVFHLYGLLYHCWSVLLHSPSSSLPHVENRTKGMQPFYCVFTYLLCSLFCNSVNSDLPKCEKIQQNVSHIEETRYVLMSQCGPIGHRGWKADQKWKRNK